MTGGRFRYLFSPLRLGPVTVANRIVFSAHLTNFAEDGRPSAQHAAYYAERAAGGAGLIITEEHSTHPTDWPYEKLIHGFDPAVVPGYRRITEAVHAAGAPIFAQLNHNGGQASSLYSRMPVWAPSPVADPLFREVPKAITTSEIAEVVAGYATVAEHARAGGFDGIELQCSHSSIVRGFLSRTTNKRTDGYGGDLTHRTRLLREVLGAVREAIGPGLALGVRLCGDELVAGGITLEEAVETARIVESTGHADYVNTSIGVATSTLFMIEASMAVPPGYALHIPAAIRRAVRLPVVGVGRFKDPLQAEHALADGHCDLVGVVRGQIADAQFAAKSRAGRSHDVRLCLSCNQECVGRMGLNRSLGCIENPRTGRESTPLPEPSRRRREVLVAGGGPAGLQAAIAAAGRGHQVSVHEATDALGGQIRLAATVPVRSELGDLVRNQQAECLRLGVRLVTGSPVDLARVHRLRPDVVVVATGSRPTTPWWVTEVEGAPPILDVRQVLDGHRVAGRVLLVDDLGFHQATSVAEWLADHGCQVEVATSGMVVGQDLGSTLDLETWWMRATRKGIVQTVETMPVGLVDGGIALQHLPTGAIETRLVDAVVLAGQQQPVDGLYHALLQSGVEVHRVGDALVPRRAHAAVLDGDRVGGSL